MPPECFRNKPASTGADIWAAGCVVHQVMKGEVLFRSEVTEENTDLKVAERIMKNIPCHLPKDYSRPLRFYVN